MGIRDIAMGSEKPEPSYNKEKGFNWGKEKDWKNNTIQADDDFGQSWWNKGKQTYKSGAFNPTKEEILRDEEEIDYFTKKETITITIEIKEEEIKETMIDYSMTGDWTEVENKAIEIAYDKLKSILKEEIESKYQMMYSVDNGYKEELDVTITLTKQ